MTAVRHLRHGDVMLALHELRTGGRTPLLLLHELGGSSADWNGSGEMDPGPVFALDLAGHGVSSWRTGGAYAPELFAADADAALDALGPARLAGAGLGAYVALLVAGARPDLVPAVLLLPGAGLDGGGARPDFARVATFGALLDDLVARRTRAETGCDPLVHSCERDPRPPDYACEFARAARGVLLAEDGRPRPPWWEALHGIPSVVVVPGDRRRALAELAPVTAHALVDGAADAGVRNRR
jgi:pimeloyl-ACP methyl ester carboxylesterase